MWLRTGWKLKKALRRYRNDRDPEAVLQMDWGEAPLLNDFFSDLGERLYGEEITKLRQKQAEYLALQNQINPHFLYNALEAIRTDALLADCEDIAETTEALATFFRYTISNVKEYVTFSDELDNAENYFTIQRCRFGDKISMELELENEQLLEARMPKLILQPIVENSLLHGLKNRGYRGTVVISAQKTADGRMEVCVRDTGSGFADGKKAAIDAMLASYDKQPPKLTGNSIGILNVQKRIKLLCGRECGPSYTENEDGGVTAHIVLPLKEEGE